jgi:hypothetical protein
MTGNALENPPTLPWLDRFGHEWGVTIRLAAIDGQRRPLEVTISPVGAPEGRWVTGTVLREIPLARLVERARQQQPQPTGLAVQMKSSPLEGGTLMLDFTHSRGPGRPPRYGRDFFVLIAKEYQEAALVTNAATQKVADAHGVKRGAVQKWLRTSRRLGLLPPP